MQNFCQKGFQPQVGVPFNIRDINVHVLGFYSQKLPTGRGEDIRDEGERLRRQNLPGDAQIPKHLQYGKFAFQMIASGT